MPIHPIFRWLRGYVQLEAVGGGAEQLLNRAVENSIALWNTSKQGYTMHTSCYASAYRRLRGPARRSGMRLHVRGRHGLPFFLRRCHARAGLAVGLALYIGLLGLLSGRIWMVDITGNERLTSQAILEVLEPLGIREGASFSAVDLRSLKLNALKQLPELTWLAVNLEGSTVHVEVRERGVYDPIDDNAPSNLIAARDGVLVAVEVTGGQAMVKTGEAVVKGSLLVSGVVDSTQGPLLKRSSGKILAKTQRTLSVSVPLEERQLLPSDETVYRASVSLFGLTIPLFSDGTLPDIYLEDTVDKALTAGGKALPIRLNCSRYRLLKERSITHTQEQAAQLAASRLEEQERVQLGGATILDRQVTQNLQDGMWQLTAVYSCIEDIAVEQQILT